MRKIRYIILVIMLSLPLCGYTLKGGVKYTVEQARKEAFADAEYRLPQSIIEGNLIDPNFKENIIARKSQKTELQDRYIGYFSDGEYCIVYKNNRLYEFYYSSKGYLLVIGKRSSLTYPLKVYRYNYKGVLTQISLNIEKGNSYIFSSNGKLESHWINKKCYDINGHLIKTQID